MAYTCETVDDAWMKVNTSTSTYSFVHSADDNTSHSLSPHICNDLPFEQMLSWVTEMKKGTSITTDSKFKEAGNGSSRMDLAVLYANRDTSYHRYNWQGYAPVLLLLRALDLPNDAFSDQNSVEFNLVLPIPETSSFEDVTSIAKAVRHYSISNVYFGVAWCWNERLKRTTVVLWCFTSEGQICINDILRELEREQSLLGHPMILAQLALRSLVRYLDVSVRKSLYFIQMVQAKMGYGNFRNEIPDNLQHKDPAKLSAQVSANAANLTISKMHLQGTVDLAKFVIDENDDFFESRKQSNNKKTLERCHGYLDQDAKRWHRRATSQLKHCEGLEKIATTVVQGLFSLTAQRDQEIRIKIAADSKTVAEEAKRDSTSMKAIAAVTMCFLPGTFVAVSLE